MIPSIRPQAAASPRVSFVRFISWFGLIVAALLALPVVASAHPGHALAQTAYLTLAPDEVRLELELTVGEDAVAPLLAALDPEGDGASGEAEVRAWGESVLGQVSVVLDGAPAAWTLGTVEVPDLALLATGSAALTLAAVAPRAEATGPHELAFQNGYMPAETLRTASVFLQPGDGWTWSVAEQARSGDGASLTVTYTTTRE